MGDISLTHLYLLCVKPGSKELHNTYLYTFVAQVAGDSLPAGFRRKTTACRRIKDMQKGFNIHNDMMSL